MAPPGYPEDWEADVLLRDGHPVHLRPIVPDDGEALRRFHSSLSPRTVYFRFFSAKPVLTDADVAYFTHVDYRDRVAFVALDLGEIIGVGRFDALGDGSAEVAFLIRDDVQGLGLGSILLEHLAMAARERGVSRFVAEVLPENSRMIATFRESGYTVDQRREEDVLAVSFAIEPTEASLAVMLSREQRAEARSMARLLRPASVAVVGASRTAGGLGHEVLRHIVDGGFTGSVVAVHPEAREIAGVPCVPTLGEAGEEVDLAVVVVPAEAVPSVLADAAAARVHGLLVISGGFGDVGESGLRRQADLVSAAHAAGMRLVGPNALGLANTDPQVRLNASLVPRMPELGRVGFFCQSGALGTAILERFRSRGLGLSTFVSAGNRADVSGNDLLQFWQDDPATDVALMYLETIGNARKFARLVHRMSPTKPVVMVRTGGAAVAHPLGHAVSHSALSQSAVDQILADCGLIVVEDIDALIDVGRVLVSQPLPSGPSVAVVGNSDALAVLAQNALRASGLSVAGEVRTFGRLASTTDYQEAVHAALADPQVGSVLLVYVPALERDVDRELVSALGSCDSCAEPHRAPVVAVMPHADSTGAVPVFADLEDAVGALAAAHRLAAWRADGARIRATPLPDPDSWQQPPPLEPGRIDGAAAVRLLAATGGVRVALDDDAPGSAGCRISLLDDPLFGPVVAVGVDDPVAEALDDRSYRLAPVSPAAALAMLERLGAVSVLRRARVEPERALAVLAQAVSDVSMLHLRAPGVVSADVRHASVTRDGDVVVGEMQVVSSDEAAATDPTVRRL